mgnify:CR=1 FL=1
MPSLARLKYNLKQGLLPFLAAVTTFGLLFSELLESPFANGWDGYFYLIQLKALVQEGQMHSPDSSPIYLLLRGLHFLVQDEMLAFKLLCSLLAGLFSFILLKWVQQLGKSTILTLALALWLIFSPSLHFFAAQFPKNLLGIDALMLLIWAMQSHSLGRKILSFVLTFVAHRMTAGLALIFLALKAFNWQRAAAFAGLICLLGFLGLLFPGFLHLADLARFEGGFQSQAHILGFAFIDTLQLGAENGHWKIEIYFSLVLLVGFGVMVAFRPLPNIQRKWQWALLGLCLFLNFPFFLMDERGMGYRFFLAFLLFAPLILGLILLHRNRLTHFGVMLLIVVSIIGWGGKFPHDQFSANYEGYSLLKAPLQNRFEEKAPSLLIAHKGLAEYLTFETGFDILPWQAEYSVDTTRFYRITSGIFPMEFRYYLNNQDESFVQELSLQYHLVREDVWQKFAKAVKAENEDQELLGRIYSWENPYQQRPQYLQRNKK